MMLAYSTMESPIGPLLLASTEKGLCFIEFGVEQEATAKLASWSRKALSQFTPVPDNEYNQTVKQQLTEYFAGKRTSFDLRIDLYGTDFQKAVWNELLKIPFGETRSYKEIALGIGAVKAVRAIGGANNRNPVPIVIPCHRVVGSNGALVGYGGGLSIKEHLLRLEGSLATDATTIKAIR